MVSPKSAPTQWVPVRHEDKGGHLMRVKFDSRLSTGHPHSRLPPRSVLLLRRWGNPSLGFPHAKYVHWTLFAPLPEFFTPFRRTLSCTWQGFPLHPLPFLRKGSVNYLPCILGCRLGRYFCDPEVSTGHPHQPHPSQQGPPLFKAFRG